MFQCNLSDLRPFVLALDISECLNRDLDGPPVTYLLPHLFEHTPSKVCLGSLIPLDFP